MNRLPDIFQALSFTAERHAHQRRKGPGGEPYINHLIEVGQLLAEMGAVEDRDILIAGILHDILEDTPTTGEEVATRFGSRVGQLVAAVSDDKMLPKAERKAKILEHLASAEDAVKLIKLADLCSNIRSIPADWSPDRLAEYFAWARQAAALCAGVSPPLDAVFAERWKSAAQTAGIKA